MERIGHEVERRLSQAGAERALHVAEITSVWPSAVGAAVAREAWPLRLGRDGTLHVATSSATWAFELDRLAPEIATRLSAARKDAAETSVHVRPPCRRAALDDRQSVGREHQRLQLVPELLGRLQPAAVQRRSA